MDKKTTMSGQSLTRQTVFEANLEARLHDFANTAVSQIEPDRTKHQSPQNLEEKTSEITKCVTHSKKRRITLIIFMRTTSSLAESVPTKRA